MSKELTPLKALKELKNELRYENPFEPTINECLDTIETALNDNKNLKEENKLLRENNENLDENYYDTWYACERLKENSNYALMFIDGTYCLVDTKDNKFDVIDEYKINNNGIIDNSSQKKLKVLDILKPFLYIDDAGKLRLRNGKNVNLISIGFFNREVIDLLKEVLK